MGFGTIAHLPEEVLLQIFGYLDTTPPSELKSRQEPSLDLTSVPDTPLKDICCTSKAWRRIALPLLFGCARIRLNRLGGSSTICSTCASLKTPISPNATEDERYHVEMIVLAEQLSSCRDSLGAFESPPPRLSGTFYALDSHYQLQEFLSFVRDNDLVSTIARFVLIAHQLGTSDLSRCSHQADVFQWFYRGSAMFWRQLLSVVNPGRVSILASPTDLACLTNAAIDTSGDWAFSDMEYHLLELRQERHNLPPQLLEPPMPYENLMSVPRQRPGFAMSSLVHARLWTHIALNEGSFLRGYGTYEYFERGPPSLIYSIKQCFKPHTHQLLGPVGVRVLAAVRSFTYTGIFPFSNHVDFLDMLHDLDELDCQFAPHLGSNILDDKARVGRAELEDCWQELFSAYYAISSALATRNGICKNVKKFICADRQIEGIQSDLDELFMPMCLPRWIEPTAGVFDRHSTEVAPLADNAAVDEED